LLCQNALAQRDNRACAALKTGKDGSLVVVTADHETGGLLVLASNGVGLLPDVSWSTGGHTSVEIPLFAVGPRAEAFGALNDNTEVFETMVSVFAVAIRALSTEGNRLH
jgi:alkaline phosphatase